LILSLALSVVAWATALTGTMSGRLPQSSEKIAATPPKDAQVAPVRFVAFGDTGTGGPGQFAIASRMVALYNSRPYDTVLMLGDNIYPDGKASRFPARFEKPYATLLQLGVRFYAVLGNHDVALGRSAQIRYRHFNMGGRAYYSFVKGDGLVEFFALDSTNMTGEQLRWLEASLSTSKALWKIAYFHHPIYSAGRKHGSNIRLRALLEPLFVRYGVAAVFSGHDHVYQRTPLQQGVQYFVAGAGGQLRRRDLNRRSSLVAAGNDEVNSFMYVEITRERMTYRAVDAEGQILDEGYLIPRAAAAIPGR
jgi:3',5'-cyclic AMP phosphodiesterase CpdA